MVNRLLLELRQVSRAPSGPATLPELAFASNGIIGNLGAPLRQSVQVDGVSMPGDEEIELDVILNGSIEGEPTDTIAGDLASLSQSSAVCNVTDTDLEISTTTNHFIQGNSMVFTSADTVASQDRGEGTSTHIGVNVSEIHYIGVTDTD